MMNIITAHQLQLEKPNKHIPELDFRPRSSKVIDFFFFFFNLQYDQLVVLQSTQTGEKSRRNNKAIKRLKSFKQKKSGHRWKKCPQADIVLNINLLVRQSSEEKSILELTLVYLLVEIE